MASHQYANLIFVRVARHAKRQEFHQDIHDALETSVTGT